MARDATRTTNPNATEVGHISPYMHRLPDGVEPWDDVIAFPASKLPDAEVD